MLYEMVHFLDRSSRLRLAHCSRTLLAHASCARTWRDLVPLEVSLNLTWPRSCPSWPSGVRLMRLERSLSRFQTKQLTISREELDTLCNWQKMEQMLQLALKVSRMDTLVLCCLRLTDAQ